MISSYAPLDAADAERLLSGTPATGDDPLSQLLAAAAAPGRADELAREDDAVRAFHMGRRTLVAPPLPRPTRHRRTRWGWALVAKVAAIVLATAGAGWALAAGTGVLPAPWEESPTVAPPSSTPGLHTGPSATPGITPTADPSTEPGSTQSPSTEPTTPRGLCQAFVSHGEDLSRLDHPSFERLVAAAGGAENVPAYCHEVLGLTPTVTPTPTAS